MKTKLSILFVCFLLVLAGNTSLSAQVTIGSGNPPHNDALLDLKEEAGGSAVKGLVLPRVPLVMTNLPDPLHEHVAGMFVYNTATAGDVTPGIYYDNGEMWIRVGSENRSADCGGTTAFTGGTVATLTNALNISGTQTALTMVAVAGVGGIINPKVNLNVLGVGILDLDLEDLGLGYPYEAASDGWLTGISATMDVTEALAFSLGGSYNIDAYLYEAQAGTSSFKEVGNTKVNLMSDKSPSLVDLEIIPPQTLHGELTFNTGEIAIKEGNRYVIMVVLTHTGGIATLAANVTGTISAGISITCDDGSGSEVEDPDAYQRQFYMPSIVLPTDPSALSWGTYDTVKQEFTIDLYTGIYARQFGLADATTSYKSAGAGTLQVKAADELEYFIVYYDKEAFTIQSLDANGVLKYKADPAKVTEKTFMNIVFKVK